VFAKFFCPPLELRCPFPLVFFEIILAVENERKLVVAIVREPENTGQGEIKLMEVAEVGAGVAFDLLGRFIGNTQRIVSQQIFYLDIIDHVLEKGLLEGQLCLFQDIILVKGKEFSEHDCSIIFQK